MKRRLDNVTLLGIDCVDIERLIQVAELSMKNFEFGEVKLLTSLPTSHPCAVKIEPISSKEEYSKFIIKELDKYIDTDFVFIIQHDGFILNPDAWTDEFLDYDYIGAPWWKETKYVVGNGGFSIRSKKLHTILATDENIKEYHPEDVATSRTYRNFLEEKGIKFAPVSLAKKFSMERNAKDGVMWTDQLGFHGLQWTDISKWLRKNPQYDIKNELNEEALELKKKLGQ